MNRLNSWRWEEDIVARRGASAAVTNPLEALDFAQIVRPGDTVTWGQASAEPLPLTRALIAQRRAVGGRFKVFLGVGYSDSVTPEAADCIDISAYCGAGANRALSEAGALDILPCHYSQYPELIRSGALKIDVLLLQTAPPDEQGRYSFGIAHEYLVAAFDAARVVIAEVNDQAPWTHGERALVEADFDFIVRTSRRPLLPAPRSPSAVERAVAAKVAGLIEDGATLQFGLGTLPEAVLAGLGDRRDLGVHSGTIGDGVADLTEAGIITNARKSVDRGVTVTGTMMGSERILRFAHRNSAVQFRSTDYTHAPDLLASIDRFTAVNSAIEVDLTGQVNGEEAAGVYVGAVGGALDFLRGARRSRGGLPIVALPSMAGRRSRIVARLEGPVTVPRSDAGLIVTEHGVADLRGTSIRERVRRLLAVAHPDVREDLERAAHGAAVSMMPGKGKNL